MSENLRELQSRIRELAYRLWEEAGRPEGRSDEFWERARQQIDEERDLLTIQTTREEETVRGRRGRSGATRSSGGQDGRHPARSLHFGGLPRCRQRHVPLGRGDNLRLA
jgi:Protein of unknown function (DUF2934)